MASIEAELRKQLAPHVSKTVFCRDVAYAFYPERHLHSAVERILVPPGPDDTSVALKLRQPPISVDDFIANMQGLFNDQFLQNFKEKCEAFDNLCGSPVSDAFIGHYSYLQWATIIGDGCFDACFDGTSDEPDEPLPVTQIHLRGKTLKQAWQTNPDAPFISTFERLRLVGWTPSATNGAEVFHGTTPTTAVMESLASTPTRLSRFTSRSQIFPPGETQAIFTSFSVMRAFLWAVFKASVIEDPPGPTESNALRNTFEFRGQTYQGVVVIKFWSSQPAPNGLTHYQIPVGQETEWSSLAMQESSGKAGDFWRNVVRSIHGQSTDDFPDLVHGKDLPYIQSALGQFPCNKNLLWQTAWISAEAAQALNARAAHIYMISFEREETTQSATESEPQSGKRERVGEFARSNPTVWLVDVSRS
ncbi:hypothetical protein ACRALDRAFT_1066500 [Sodiomyces alcalophilus JCM 7366]|uniref:uncharacterized protein n=1 Tax=Sodiomyces alcalophilus JCM 7366 TaxID=591952 RepID=UPI0039B471B0